MVDQRVIDYIKAQLSKGISTNQIKQNLLSKGWHDADINQAINIAMENNPEIKKHVSISTIIGVAIIILASSVLIFFLVGGADLLNPLSSSVPETSSTLPPQTESSQVIDCGGDFDCLVDKAENCELSKLANTQVVELFGMVITTASYIELKGINSSKCIYYQQTINQTIAFSEEFKQQMVSEGSTQEEIDQQQDMVNEEAKSSWGLEKTCKFNTEDLVSMFSRWKVGNSSTEDFDVAECE